MGLQKTWAASRKCKAETGFRSPPEVQLSAHLESLGLSFFYETARIPYLTPQVYIPDFALSRQAILLEVKGYFPPSDRAKMLRIRAGHPDLDIRFLFTNPDTRISPRSKTTYAAWCRKHGFPCARGPLPPAEWLAHRPSPAQAEAFKRIFPDNGNP